MTIRTALVSGAILSGLSACGPDAQRTAGPEASCQIELIVLGAGQDAGAPQFGNPDDPAWTDHSLRLTPTALALVDYKTSKRYLFEASPQITEQLNRLDEIMPPAGPNEGISGVFITHAHIGHFAGLIFFGREAASTSRVPVYAMPRLLTYFSENGPWDQLVALDNIALEPLQDRMETILSPELSVTPYRVPHRDEYSETVGFVIEAGAQNALFLPDIDSWDDWETEFDVRIEDMISEVDLAFIDATFYDDFELPGRDMSEIPHPRVTDSMERLDGLPQERKSGVHFIHYNHTNAIRFADSEETGLVLEQGFNIAREGDRHCLLRDQS